MEKGKRKGNLVIFPTHPRRMLYFLPRYIKYVTGILSGLKALFCRGFLCQTLLLFADFKFLNDTMH